MFAGTRLALGLLTIIPVRPPADLNASVARRAMLMASLVVLPVTVLAGLAGWGAQVIGMPIALAGVVSIAVVALGTRAMHLDGLADTVDALGSGRDVEGALHVMKAGDIGPMGATALILVLVAEVLAAGVVVARPWGWLYLAVLVAASRVALLFGCLAEIPAARPEGLGALVAGSVPLVALIAGWLLAGAAVTASAVLTGQPYWWPISAVVLAAVVSAALTLTAVKRFGGITGDVLGAQVELAAAVLLLGAAIA
ncbi:MAG TPA: adenosylcobinamide-GDP ribazoletransferase [Propionibacteriaceae bacterium]|nr:adenosylcobinamide-GDP ribazoletransferase [Propionibacteriaceae bacterium]